MNVQVIMRDGAPDYAVLPWAEYQALLVAAGQREAVPAQPVAQPQPQRPSLGELGRLRQAGHLSIEELARSVGISPPYLALIESGERAPDAAIRRALARALGVEGWEEDA